MSASAKPLAWGGDARKPNTAHGSQQSYHRLIANGRGRSMTRPSWMRDSEFTSLLGERPPEVPCIPMNDGSGEAEPPPIQAAILSRVISLRNAFDPKRLVKNRYLADDSQGDDSVSQKTFPDVEREFLSKCAQYGFVRYVNAWAELRGGSSECVVRIGFATKEGAKLCCDAWHGKLMPWGLAVVADFDLKAGNAAASTVSRAIWIGNVFQAVKTPQQALQLQASFQAAYRAAASAAAASAQPGGDSGGRAPLSGCEGSEDEDYFEQLEKDFAAECSRFGPVKSVSTAPAEGCVHVVFGSVLSAGDGLHAMHGRWFEERLMWAEYDLEYEETPDENEEEDGDAPSGTSGEEGNKGKEALEGLKSGRAEQQNEDDDAGHEPPSSRAPASLAAAAGAGKKRRAETCSSSQGKQQMFSFALSSSSISSATAPGGGSAATRRREEPLADKDADWTPAAEVGSGLKALALPLSVTSLPLLRTAASASSSTVLSFAAPSQPLANPYASFGAQKKHEGNSSTAKSAPQEWSSCLPFSPSVASHEGEKAKSASCESAAAATPEEARPNQPTGGGGCLLGLVEYDSDE